MEPECGLLIASPVLATQVADLLDDAVQRAAWRVRLADDGVSLRWTLASGQCTEHDVEPDTDLCRPLRLDLLAPSVPEERL